MPRLSMLRRWVLFVAAALALVAGGPAATAQEVADHPIVGTWRVYLGDDPHVHGLLIHHADGTLSATDPITMAIAPDVTAYASGAFGVWEATGPDTIAYTYQQFHSDAAGNVTGIVTISGTREVSADGQSFGGAGVFQLADPEGNVLLSAPAPDVRGERMAVVPMEDLASPVASPAS